MEKRIKKIQLLNELEKFSGNNEVLINVIFFRYNKWKNKWGIIGSVDKLIEFLSEIATFQNALQYERLDSWKPSDIDLKFKAEEIKTAEEWYSAGKISELAMEMIISSENQELDYIKWWGIEISGKFYYSLSCLKDIKDRLKVEEATQVALSINNKI